MNESPSLPGKTQFSERTDAERREILAAEVRTGVEHGWRVESQSDFQAVLTRGKRPNHVLHLLLTIFTLGLWAIVWVLLALFSHERRKVITVGAYPDVMH